MKKKMSSRDIEFLFELGSLRNIDRSWRQTLGVDCANILEHTFRVMFLALTIARGEKVRNEEKIIKMAMIHDLGESRTGDPNYVQKVYVNSDESRALKDMLHETGFTDFYKFYEEYESRKSIEAKIVKDADNLDVDFEIKELEERGSLLPKKWKVFRKQIRVQKYYTKTAKKLWDALEKSDPATWHLLANKWIKIPDAGR